MDADIPETMLAWRVPRFGGVEALRQESVSVPEPAQGEVNLVFDLVGGDTQERSWAVVKNGGSPARICTASIAVMRQWHDAL